MDGKIFAVKSWTYFFPTVSERNNLIIFHFFFFCLCLNLKILLVTVIRYFPPIPCKMVGYSNFLVILFQMKFVIAQFHKVNCNFISNTQILQFFCSITYRKDLLSKASSILGRLF
jgi:hypothetical protein